MIQLLLNIIFHLLQQFCSYIRKPVAIYFRSLQ